MTFTCTRCGHVWEGRPLGLGREKPVKCPKCQSHNWDENESINATRHS